MLGTVESGMNPAYPAERYQEKREKRRRGKHRGKGKAREESVPLRGNTVLKGGARGGQRSGH